MGELVKLGCAYIAAQVGIDYSMLYIPKYIGTSVVVYAAIEATKEELKVVGEYACTKGEFKQKFARVDLYLQDVL